MLYEELDLFCSCIRANISIMLHKTIYEIKRLVHFQIKIDLFTHPHVIQDVYVFLSSVENKLRFLIKTFQISIHIVNFNGLQTVEGQNDSFSAASKG